MQTSVSKISTMASDHSLSPGRRQAIIGTSARILSNGALGESCIKKAHFKLPAIIESCMLHVFKEADIGLTCVEDAIINYYLD